jgi:hypothetical protein
MQSNIECDVVDQNKSMFEEYIAEHVDEIDHLKYMLESVQVFVQSRYFHRIIGYKKKSYADNNHK